ncbi:outer membrane usher protein [Pseudomonas sp. 8O]|uniref:outer membrane usher protein n=1 Tax=Pseudomonas sp. 8O TaxID=2653165 RepID=UPI0012EF806D|nr:outer membrane usher protein [Pseudomonas sp. 8O]VXC36178.1 putative outer membrane usher protein YfcU [Pseudomonas sp. 8O]
MARNFSRSLLAAAVSLGLGALVGVAGTVQAQEIRFNTDILDSKDRENIDLSVFNQKGYILPGTYELAIKLNGVTMPARSVTFMPPADDPSGSEACLTPDLVELIGLTADARKTLTWWNGEQCLALSSLDGMDVKGDIGVGVLNMSVPQAYIEYSSPDWDPPTRWEEGIAGLVLDYNINAQNQWQDREGTRDHNISGTGVVGANIGAWRLRANWQARHQSGSGRGSEDSFDWTQYSAYRAIKPLRAKLTVGEDYLYSDIFDSFRFLGASLVTEDNMLPPNLRGYAPEVTGVARTNARVVISQQGRVIKEVLVPAGSFRIQDLNSAVAGKLDVRIEEADGSTQEFQVDTASIPYLTRPGQLRYKLVAGRPTDWDHNTNGPFFAGGEFSWGVSNGWSLYGGALLGDDYNALSVGIGRDLMEFGALSADVTQSSADLPEEGKLTGRSYRLSYSKRFDETNSQVTFAGYRFSDDTFLSMSDYISVMETPGGIAPSRGKELYTATFNQQFPDYKTSIYFNVNHQTYWNRRATDRYNLTLARYFDFGEYRNISLSLTAYRNEDRSSEGKDQGMYLSLTMPWGSGGTVGYNGSFSSDRHSNSATYSNRVSDADYYQVRGGETDGKTEFGGYYSHRGTYAQVDTTASAVGSQYRQVGVSLSGGATLTAEGGALHRISTVGGTRMFVDTDGVSDVPVGGYGSSVKSNYFGKAVVTDIGSYHRNSVQIDINKLPENADSSASVVQGTLTEGAIGYRHFDVISGAKAIAAIRLDDGSTPPFGTAVLNARQQEVGMVTDGGEAYLTGLKSGDILTAHWAGREQCRMAIPDAIPADMAATLPLACVKN